jgi:hypothetical protein
MTRAEVRVGPLKARCRRLQTALKHYRGNADISRLATLP